MGHVEFLVGPEAFEMHGALVTLRPGIPLSAEGVPIDSMRAPASREAALTAALEDSVEIDGVPVICPEVLVLMKRIAGRRQDLADIAVLLRIGAVNAERVRARLAQLDQELRDGFEALITDAER